MLFIKESLELFLVTLQTDMPHIDVFEWSQVFVVVDGYYCRLLISGFERPLKAGFLVSRSPLIIPSPVVWKAERAKHQLIIALQVAHKT